MEKINVASLPMWLQQHISSALEASTPEGIELLMSKFEHSEFQDCHLVDLPEDTAVFASYYTAKTDLKKFHKSSSGMITVFQVNNAVYARIVSYKRGKKTAFVVQSVDGASTLEEVIEALCAKIDQGHVVSDGIRYGLPGKVWSMTTPHN